MKTLFLLFLLLTCSLGYSQEKPRLQCSANPCEEPPRDTCHNQVYYSDTIDHFVLRRLNQYDFHKTLQAIRDPGTVSLFSNWALNNLGTQKKNCILDGDLNNPIAIQAPKELGNHTIHVIPRIRIRIFQNDKSVGDSSLPVRTPSAMPGIAYYWSPAGWWHWEKKMPTFKEKYFGVYVFHHSDGQDGPEIDTVRKRVNTYNGNFGEDIIFEFILGGRKKFVADDHKYCSVRESKRIRANKIGARLYLKQAVHRELYWRMSYEWHPEKFTNTVFNSLNIYGRHRLNLSLSYLFLPELQEFFGDGINWCSVTKASVFERWRHTLNVSYILDDVYYRGEIDNLKKVNYLNFKRRLNINYALYFVMGKSQFSAAFAQIGYEGSDSYNIYFNNSIFILRAGFAFGFFKQEDSNIDITQ